MLSVSQDQTQTTIARLRWRCRRGMLELDLLFESFVGQHLAQLDAPQLQALNQLLDLPDQRLWYLLTVSDEGESASVRQVLEKLRGEA